MLILTRKVGKSIFIDDGVRRVRVTVVAIRGSNVRIGIDAPREIEIHRKEVCDRTRHEPEETSEQ